MTGGDTLEKGDNQAGWVNQFTKTWHSKEPCAGGTAVEKPLSKALDEGYDVCQVCHDREAGGFNV